MKRKWKWISSAVVLTVSVVPDRLNQILDYIGRVDTASKVIEKLPLWLSFLVIYGASLLCFGLLWRSPREPSTTVSLFDAQNRRIELPPPPVVKHGVLATLIAVCSVLVFFLFMDIRYAQRPIGTSPTVTITVREDDPAPIQPAKRKLSPLEGKVAK